MSRPRKRGKRAAKCQLAYASSGVHYLEQVESSPLVYKGEPVVSLGMAARLLNMPIKAVRNKWRTARGGKRRDGAPKFVEGTHQHTVKGGDLKALKAAVKAGSRSRTLPESTADLFGIHPFTTSVVLLTERGFGKFVAGHFPDSDEADEIRERLLDTYFVAKALPTNLELVARKSFQAGLDHASAQHGSELKLLRQSVDYLIEEHQAAKAKTKEHASAHARGLSHRKAEKRREVRTDLVLGEVAGALDPGRKIDDERGQGYLFSGLTRLQVENMLQATLAATGYALTPVGGAQ